MTVIWENVKDQIKNELSSKSFSLWINPIQLVQEEDKKLVLGCPNKFSLNWITENYRGIIEKTVSRISGSNYSLDFQVAAFKKSQKKEKRKEEHKQLILNNLTHARIRGRQLPNNEFTFDRFVVGKCNEFAYSASKAMARGEQWTNNHLYMLANTGLGKSHLSQAIGHSILEDNPNTRICYITAEDFINEMTFALKNRQIDEFKNKYRRSCDVLLLEEVHFLSGKEKTQLELGYTLDALANDNKKIIFTSSMLPKNIPNLINAISSRLTSGLITALEPPDYETRVSILMKKSEEQGLQLSEDVIHILAKNLTSDIRHIESSLRCLKAKSDLLNENINLDLAKEVIKSHITEQETVGMDKIRSLVCKYYKIPSMILSSKSRKRIHALPRSIYVFFCRNYTDATVEEIGKSINRNHSTIIYSLDSIEQKMKRDRKIKNQVDFLKQKIEDICNDK